MAATKPKKRDSQNIHCGIETIWPGEAASRGPKKPSAQHATSETAKTIAMVLSCFSVAAIIALHLRPNA
jgi:hypothetical protein